jgi:hypothetical protein
VDRRYAFWCGAGGWLVAAVLVLGAWCLPLRAAAHELDFQSLVLIWDEDRGELKGQVVSLPGAVSGVGEVRAARLSAFLRENLALEVDGVGCELGFQVRELWLPAGATAGDVVMLSCLELDRVPRSLRVFAGEGMHGLRVSVQRIERSGAVVTDDALVLGGAWSARYFFRGGWGVEGEARGWALAWEYVRYGVEHILDEGWDHVAFVATLVLGVLRVGFAGLILRLSAFTVAHSITLALGALGWVVLPRAVVEPLIALSIALLALVHLMRWRSPALKRWDLVLPFAFGLLHGQGFASVLVDAGLPLSGFLVALLAFNVGVELGQALWASVFWFGARALPAQVAPRVLWLCALGLALLGLYWTWERTLG